MCEHLVGGEYTYLCEASASVVRSDEDGQFQGLKQWERASSMALTLFFVSCLTRIRERVCIIARNAKN